MALDERKAISISREGGMVILTMTPQRAQLIAASIWLGEANHRAWLDDLSTVMEGAAEGSGVFAHGAASEEASEVPNGVALHLPLPRDKAPVVHDPILDTLYSPDALAAALAARANDSVASALQAVTAQAAMEAKEAVAAAAATTARAATSAKLARAMATAGAANAVADVVSRTASEVRLQADARAETARGVKDADAATAVNLARETDLAAVAVARAAAEAAMQAATAAADAAMELEMEVAATAADVAAVAAVATLRLAAHAQAAAHLVQAAQFDTVTHSRGDTP